MLEAIGVEYRASAPGWLRPFCSAFTVKLPEATVALGPLLSGAGNFEPVPPYIDLPRPLVFELPPKVKARTIGARARIETGPDVAGWPLRVQLRTAHFAGFKLNECIVEMDYRAGLPQANLRPGVSVDEWWAWPIPLLPGDSSTVAAFRAIVRRANVDPAACHDRRELPPGAKAVIVLQEELDRMDERVIRQLVETRFESARSELLALK